MATSGVKIYEPKAVDLIEKAYIQLGKDPQMLPRQALTIARESATLLFNDWMNDFTPQWLIEETYLQIEPNQRVYSLPSGIDQIYENQILVFSQDPRVEGNENVPYENIITNLTPDEYQNQQNFGGITVPYAYWFNRKIDPKEIRLVGNPDQNYWLRFLGVYKPDIIVNSLNMLEIPQRWQSAFVSGMAVKMAPEVEGGAELLPILVPLYEETYRKAYDSEGDDNDLVIDNYVFEGFRGGFARGWKGGRGR